MQSLRTTSHHITVLIPTRNRPELAIQTIESWLKQPHSGYRIIVSDNSTRADAVRTLGEFCANHASSCLSCVRPPHPLPMADHWQWALTQVLQDHSNSHVIVATDRMVFYQGVLADFASVVAQNPRSVITFNNDSILDIQLPCRILRRPWSGKLHRIPSTRFLEHAAHMRGLYMVPKLLNCVVPREVLQRVANRFGDFCVSLSPDYAFAWRCLAVEEDILLYDRSLVVHHAFTRSNGTSWSRGVMSVDSRDFQASQQKAVRLTATPAPEVLVGTNAMIHEYCVVRNFDSGAQLPHLDLSSYFRNLFEQVAVMENPEVRAHYTYILRAAERQLLGEKHSGKKETPAHRDNAPRRLTQRLIQQMKAVLKSGPTKPIWYALADRLGVRPPNYIDFGFASFEKAMEFANRFPLPRLPQSDHLRWIDGQDEAQTEQRRVA